MRVILAVCGVFLGSIVSMTLTKPNSYEEYSFPRDCEINDRRPNLVDPNSFYWCLADGPILMKCVTGTFFNVTTGKCMLEEIKHSDTEETQKTEPSPRCPQPKFPPRGINCPVVDPMEYSIYHADKQACGCFYQCDNGVPKRRACRADLHFNATTNLCDWPEKAGCQPYDFKDIDLDIDFKATQYNNSSNEQ